MSPSQPAVEALGVAVAARVPVLLWGAPGTGKTSAIRAMAQTMGLPCETVIASIREPSDFAGLPIVVGDGVRFAPPAWARRLAEAGHGLLFLDELSTAPPAVQAALLRVVLERVVGDLTLPDAVAVVAAANPPEQAADGWDLASGVDPLRGRDRGVAGQHAHLPGEPERPQQAFHLGQHQREEVLGHAARSVTDHGHLGYRPPQRREHDLARHGGPARRPSVGVVDRPADLGDGAAQFGREQGAPVDLGGEDQFGPAQQPGRHGPGLPAVRHDVLRDLPPQQVGLPAGQAPGSLAGPGHPVRAAAAVKPGARRVLVRRLSRTVLLSRPPPALVSLDPADPLEVLLGQQPVPGAQVAGEHRPAGQVESGRHEVVVDLGVGGADPGGGLLRPDARHLRPLAMRPQQVADVVDQHAAQLRRGPAGRQLGVGVHPPALVHRHGAAARLRDHLDAEHPRGQVRELGRSPQPGRRQLCYLGGDDPPDPPAAGGTHPPRPPLGGASGPPGPAVSNGGSRLE